MSAISFKLTGGYLYVTLTADLQFSEQPNFGWSFVQANLDILLKICF